MSHPPLQPRWTRRLASGLDMVALAALGATLVVQWYCQTEMPTRLLLLASACLALVAAAVQRMARRRMTRQLAQLSDLARGMANEENMADLERLTQLTRDALRAAPSAIGDIPHALTADLVACAQALVQQRNVLTDQTELICRWLPDGTLTYVNEAYCRYFSQSHGDLIGRKFTPLIPDGYQEAVVAACGALLPESPVGTTVHPVVLSGGRWRWQHWTDRGIFSEAGELVEIQSVGRDVTEQHDAESALRAQRDLAFRLAAASDKQTIHDAMLDAGMAMPGTECGGVYEVNSQTGDLHLMVHRGLAPSFVQAARHYPADSAHAGIVRAGIALHYRPEALASLVPPEVRRHYPRELAIIPILHEGRPVACLNLGSFSQEPMPALSRQALEAVAAEAGGALARVQAVDDIARSRQNLQALFDNLSDMVTVGDEYGRIIETSAAVERVLGYSRDELLGKPIDVMHPPERRAEAGEIVRAMLEGRTSVCVLPLQARDGTCVPAETVVTMGTWDGRPAMLGISRDISDRERTRHALAESTLNRALAEELRRLSLGLAAAQEEERRRLAMELHDQVGQCLTGLQLLLEGRTTLSPERYLERVDLAHSIVGDVLERVRRMSLELHPPALDDLGLFAALRLHFGRFAEQSGIVVDAHLTGDDDSVPTEVRLAAFRVVQESLTNVARHANVDQTTVSVEVTDTHLNLEVCDAGDGFCIGTTLSGTLGIGGMRERVRGAGGQLDIISDPGTGTTVRATIGLEPPATDGLR